MLKDSQQVAHALDSLHAACASTKALSAELAGTSEAELDALLVKDIAASLLQGLRPSCLIQPTVDKDGFVCLAQSLVECNGANVEKMSEPAMASIEPAAGHACEGALCTPFPAPTPLHPRPPTVLRGSRQYIPVKRAYRYYLYSVAFPLFIITLSACLAFFGTCLYAPTIALQAIAALSLCKIVLAASDAIPRPGDGDKEDKAPPRNAGGGKAGAAGRGKGGKGGKAKGAKKTAGKRQLPGGSDVDTSDEEEKPAEAAPEEEGTAAASNAPAQEEATTSATTTILHSVANPEQLLAHLAQRYTAQSPHLDTMPKKEVAKNTDLMAKLQECFDVLARARRIADISNTVVFVLLNAGDEGALEPLRAPAVLGHAPPTAEVLDPQTLRCVRFLSHLLVEVIPWEEGDRPRADDLVKAVQVNLKMEHQLMVPRNEIARWLAVKV